MESKYILMGTYALDRNGKYNVCLRTHVCVVVTCNHDGVAENEARSFQSAITNMESSMKKSFADQIFRDYDCTSQYAEDLASTAYWLSRSVAPSLSGQVSDS
jgi:hypothetical protein